MKKILRKKMINGQWYWYEITPYYDPKIKRTRHKSKYLGKDVDGKPVKVRSKLPRTVYSYGEFLPLFAIAEELDLYDLLGGIFSEQDVYRILTLAYNRVLRPMSLYHIASWYDTTVLSLEYGSLPLSSQSLSRFLSTIGDSTAPMMFSTSLVSRLGGSRTYLYDITSFSSTSELIKLLEYGYNRDGEKLPQINFSLMIDSECGIPVFYDIYPGSIVDVSTLRNTISKARSIGIENTMLIMDRGFFSIQNISELMEHGYSFIMPIPMNYKVAKENLSRYHSKIKNPNNLHMWNNKVIFSRPLKITIGEYTLHAHMYYSPNREYEESDTLYRRLNGCIETLKHVSLKPWMNHKEVFNSIAGPLSKYLDWRVVGNRFDVKYRKRGISQRINRMGRFILLSSDSLEWDDMLSLYRSRDMVEKAFEELKQSLEVMPMNVRKDPTLRGFIFISFISLLLRFRLYRMLKDAGLLEKNSVDGILLEFEKIKKVRLSNDEIMVTEVPKKVRDILEKLNITIA